MASQYFQVMVDGLTWIEKSECKCRSLTVFLLEDEFSNPPNGLRPSLVADVSIDPCTYTASTL